MKSNKYILFSFLCLIYFLFYSGIDPADKKLLKPLTNDDYNYIAINEILMYISNNGDGSHDPVTDGNGFYWPGGKWATKSAIFEDGLIWGGKVNGEIRVNGSTHRHGLQAGKILPGGAADNPDDARYRVYRIRKDWKNFPQGPEREALERDFHEWPVEDGAPWVDINGDGVYSPDVDTPDFIGDEILWYVSNDLDTTRSRFTYGSDPIGLEIQTLVWGYKEFNFLKDVVYKKYTIINKSTSTLDSMYLGYWVDDDLGDAGDDYVGCDTLINLAYTYNGDNDDGGGTGNCYGTPPPAVGHMFSQGPIIPGEPTDSARFKGQTLAGYKNLPITAFMFYIGPHSVYQLPQSGNYVGSLELYNNLRGQIWNGNFLIDPHTGLPTKFPLSGDPTAGRGWYEGEGWPGGAETPDDRFYIMSSGPFSMSPSDTQEVIIAIFMAIGDDYIDSIKKLKETALKIHQFFGNDIPSTVEEKKLHIPNAFRLLQNYPNPFNPSTTIEFTLPKSEVVKIQLYNISGQKIETLLNKRMTGGNHKFEFHARNLASGIYFYQIQAGQFLDVKKMALLR